MASGGEERIYCSEGFGVCFTALASPMVLAIRCGGWREASFFLELLMRRFVVLGAEKVKVWLELCVELCVGKSPKRVVLCVGRSDSSKLGASCCPVVDFFLAFLEAL